MYPIHCELSLRTLFVVRSGISQTIHEAIAIFCFANTLLERLQVITSIGLRFRFLCSVHLERFYWAFCIKTSHGMR